MKQGKTGRKLLSTLALLAGLSAISAPAANAAAILRGYMAGVPSSSLSPGDWDAFQAAAGDLLSKMPSTIGDSKDWTGPSGASGTLTIERIFEQKNMPCRTVKALFKNKTTPGGSNYSLNVCRNSEGDWKIVN